MHQIPHRCSALAAALLLAAAAGASPAAAQEPEVERPFEEEIEVTEVLLDVLVTDRQGNVIVGLGPEDFVVREDGEPVAVEDVTFYSSSVPEESAAELEAKGVAVDRVPEDRYFILFFDDVGKYEGNRVSLMQQQLRAAADAKEWVRESLAPADWVAVAGFDRKLELHQDFTRDREAILAALDRAARGDEGRQNWSSRRGDDAAAPSLADDLPSGRALLRATPRIYEALTLVARAAEDVRGRKNLIYFGIGFGDVDRFGQYREDPRYYPEMEQALNDANVAVYPVDVTPQGVTHPFENALSQVADDTGGRYYPFFTSFNTPLDRIAAESSGYYLLAYRATHRRGDEGFQSVDVDTVDPSFRVRARGGYSYGEPEGGAAGAAGAAEATGDEAAEAGR
ncbi:MAG TPA: VWA domain-containing protein [Thermoanaerobaculia bacterium]|nr:VWA domain-containing protein [Thermoanaerobaculia bacterium]